MGLLPYNTGVHQAKMLVLCPSKIKARTRFFNLRTSSADLYPEMPLHDSLVPSPGLPRAPVPCNATVVGARKVTVPQPKISILSLRQRGSDVASRAGGEGHAASRRGG